MKHYLRLCLITKMANIFMVLTTINATAQKPTVGLKAGLGFSDIKQKISNPDAEFNTFMKVAFSGGVFLNVPAGKKLVFHPEILFVSKGYRAQYSNYKGSDPLPYLDTYLNILYKPANKNGSFFIGAGPSLGLPIFGTSYIDNWSANRKADFGIHGLAGYEFPIGASVMLQYTYGLTNIIKQNDPDDNIYNRFAGISFGYSF